VICAHNRLHRPVQFSILVEDNDDSGDTVKSLPRREFAGNSFIRRMHLLSTQEKQDLTATAGQRLVREAESV